MTTSPQVSVNPEVLPKFVRYLASAGYQEYSASFSPLTPSRARWREALDAAPRRLRPLLELFLVGEPIAEQDIEPVLGEFFEDLLGARLLERRADGRIATPDLVLRHVAGYWLFTQRPQPNMTLYFGDDSMGLLMRLAPAVGGVCLDLCSGPGVQALHCSSFASRVTAVDINPVAVALARVNTIMNGRHDRIEVLCGDLYRPVAGKRFDTITANPPLLPFPDEVRYPFVGHGGRDGLRIIRRILAGLPSALNEGGVAQLIGSCLSDGVLPLCMDELAAQADEARLDILMTVTGGVPLRPGTPYFEGLVRTACCAHGLRSGDVAEAFARSLDDQQATALCGYFLLVTRGTGRLRLMDVARQDGASLWHV